MEFVTTSISVTMQSKLVVRNSYRLHTGIMTTIHNHCHYFSSLPTCARARYGNVMISNFLQLSRERSIFLFDVFAGHRSMFVIMRYHALPPLYTRVFFSVFSVRSGVVKTRQAAAAVRLLNTYWFFTRRVNLSRRFHVLRSFGRCALLLLLRVGS